MYKPDSENIQKYNFGHKNKWSIPEIKGVDSFENTIEFIGFNYAKTFEKKNKTEYGVHFFLDDYQFERIWNSPSRYVELLKKFKYVLSPDFSMYVDFPKVMQLWKHYQKHWIGAFLERQGVKVIPTIGWSDHDSYKWCFDGEPKNSIVAVSSIGTQKYAGSKYLFLDGYNEMLKRLNPRLVLFWGNIPKEIDLGIVKPMGYIMDEKFKLLRK